MSTGHTGQEKRCPRCGALFVCHATTQERCHCGAFRLSQEQRENLARTYHDCLCGACLAALSQRPSGFGR